MIPTSVRRQAPGSTRPRLRAFVGGLALAATVAPLGACLDITVDENRALRVTLSATPTSATVGQSVSFRFEAEGRDLAAVVLSYGDGVADTLEAFAAQEAAATFDHSFSAVADHRAVATVYEGATGRILADTVVVSVTAAAGG